MSIFQGNGIGKKLAIAATGVSLLTGCLKKESEPTAAAPDRSEHTEVALPKAVLVASPALVSFFQDKSVPTEVKSALLNEGAVQALREVLDSGKTTMAMTYRRDAYPPEIGRDAVRILQYLLNSARLPAQAKLETARIASMESKTKLAREVEAAQARLKKVPSPQQRAELTNELAYAKYKLSDAEVEAAFLKQWVHSLPAQVAIDGDYGRACHGLRAYITQSERWVDRTFPHIKQDSGSSDTGIGPKTLKLLLRHAPAISEALTGPHTEVEYAARSGN